MDCTRTRFSWWNFWKGKDKEPVSNESSLISSTDSGVGLKEVDNVKFPWVKGAKVASSTKKVKAKWKSREQRRINKDRDGVLVPQDGVCLWGSESNDSDWSIGWLEPLAPDFQSDEEAEDGFAVLVRCYREVYKELEGPDNQLLGAIRNPQNVYADLKGT